MDETTTTTTKPLMQKTQDELTVGESLKIATGATIVSMMVPVVMLGGIAGYGYVSEKLKERKAKKAEAKIIDIETKKEK